MTGRGQVWRHLQCQRRRAVIPRCNRCHHLCSKGWKGIRCSRLVHHDAAAGRTTRTMARLFVRRARRFPSRQPSAWAASTMRAHATASASASWWCSGIPSRRQTSGSFVGRIPHCARARSTVHTNRALGGRRRYRAQQACRTLRSNDALWAATKAASGIQVQSVGHNSAKVGASRTSSQHRP